jgi:hypothetical protein
LLKEPPISEEEQYLLTKKLIDCFVYKFTERVRTNFIPKMKDMLDNYNEHIQQEPYESNRLEMLSRIDAIKREIIQNKKEENKEKTETILSLLNPLNLINLSEILTGS